ncbi:MAG: hypothetical protein ACRDF4_12190 [Rhabdochlamydiaceae bacterium]
MSGDDDDTQAATIGFAYKCLDCDFKTLFEYLAVEHSIREGHGVVRKMRRGQG